MKIEAAGAVVSGGASGLGEATVRRLHAGGAQVVVADVNPEKGEALASELGISFVQCDVREEDQVQAAVDKAAEAEGGLRIAVSCAGTGIPREGRLAARARTRSRPSRCSSTSTSWARST